LQHDSAAVKEIPHVAAVSFNHSPHLVSAGGFGVSRLVELETLFCAVHQTPEDDRQTHKERGESLADPLIVM